MNSVHHSPTKRTFFALPVPLEVSERLYAEVRGLREQFHWLKWVPAENLHFTLCFLGDTPVEAMPGVVERLRAETAGIEPFEVELGDFGVFPKPRNARVFWMGTRVGEGPMVRLAEAARRSVEGVPGLHPDLKPFVPHLTLARGREPFNAASLLEKAGSLGDASALWFSVSEVVWLESEVKGRGSMYLKLKSVPLEKEIR